MKNRSDDLLRGSNGGITLHHIMQSERGEGGISADWVGYKVIEFGACGERVVG